MLKQQRLAFMVAGVLSFSGCGFDHGSALRDEGVGEGFRASVMQVTFGGNDDYIVIDGAIRAEGERCVILAPRANGETTKKLWHPLQAFWVVTDSDRATLGAHIADTYFDGDGFGADRFDAQGIPAARGFASLTPTQIRMMTIEEFVRGDDQQTIDVTFGSIIDAKVRAKATYDAKDRRCAFVTSYCPRSSSACTAAADYEEFTRINVKTIFSVPTGVEFL